MIPRCGGRKDEAPHCHRGRGEAMSNRCVDCSKEIDPRAKRCASCAGRVRWECGIYDDPETRRRMSESMKAAWERGDFDNPETRKKRSEGIKASWARGAHDSLETYNKKSKATRTKWERGDFDDAFDDLEYRRQIAERVKAAHACGDYDGNSEAIKAAWERGAYDGVFRSPTSIELAVAAALDICGIEHVSQYRPEGHSRIYDEFVPSSILIEVHGDYWHGLERPEKQARDVEKATWADENGYRLVVIWEHEIKEQGAWALVHERILPLMAQGAHP